MAGARASHGQRHPETPRARGPRRATRRGPARPGRGSTSTRPPTPPSHTTRWSTGARSGSQRGAAGAPRARPHPGQHRAAGDRSQPRHRALVLPLTGDTLFVGRRAGPTRRRAGRSPPLREPHRAPPAVARQRRGIPGPRRRIELRAGHVEQDRDHDRVRAALQRRPAGARRGGVRPAPHDRAAAQAAQLRPHHRA